MRILLVEDNPKLGEATRTALVRAGFSTDLFRSAGDGWHAWQSESYNVAILDIMLAPEIGEDEESGLQLLARARAAGISTPVILLTALGSVEQRVRGLETGADDYLVKPFAVAELVARLKALGRRPLSLADDVIRIGNLAYDRAAKQIVVGDRRASLSRGESVILDRLLGAPGRVISKAQLGDSLHSLDEDYTENSIHVHIHRVRSKLTEQGSTVAVRTLRGLGYMAVDTSRST